MKKKNKKKTQKSEKKKLWLGLHDSLFASVISLPLEFGSHEYVFERFSSFARYDGRLFIYLISVEVDSVLNAICSLRFSIS